MSVDKQDSNSSGLRYAEEATLKTLPGSPVFYQLEPNSYKDFGGQLTTVARKPISNTRQRKKGTPTDLDASGGINQDLTMTNLWRLMQGFFFASVREKHTTLPMNATAIACTSVTASDKKYNYGTDPGTFAAGALILAAGFGVAANNGLKHVVSADTNDVTVSEVIVNEASPPAAAGLTIVGRQAASADLTLAMSGSQVVLGSTALDFTTLGLLAGEWIYVGGDTSAMQFDSGHGLARIAVGGIAAHAVTFDKVGWEATADTGTAKTIQLFFGSLLRNEPVYADILRRTYHIERTLGSDTDGVMSEYLVGAVPNEITWNIPEADKVTVDMTFVALDNEQRSGATGLKTGTRPNITPEDAINTSSDVGRIKLATVSGDASPDPLFAYATDLSLSVTNNVTPNKAIGTLGGFNTSAGTFEVSGKLEVYFATIQAVQAVRSNADVTLDILLAKANAGLLLDVPLLSLGDGRLNVELDKPITLPLSSDAAESAFGYTLAMMRFPYLPDIAM